MPTPIFIGYPTPPQVVKDRDSGAEVNIPEPLEYGTINLHGRRPVKLSLDGKRIVPLAKKRGVDFEYGTVLSLTIGPLQIERFPGQKVMVILPSLDIEKQLVLTEKQATDKFLHDGLHLGIFTDESITVRLPNDKTRRVFLADAYAYALHLLEEKRLEQFLADDPTLKPWSTQNYSNEPALVMPSDSGFITEVFAIAGVKREDQDFLSGRLLSLSVSYSMTLTTQLTATYDDKNYDLTRNGYFDPRREYKYRGLLFEVVSCDSGAGTAGYPQATVEFAPKCVQELKRDKRPESITASTGFEYARRAAARCGMNFVGEKNSKQQSVFKGRGQNTDESVWTVLTQTGSEGQFFVFEVDNTLVYGSGQWLMWKFGLSEKKSKKGKMQRFLDLRFDPTLPHSGALPVRRVLKGEFIYVDLDVTSGLPLQNVYDSPATGIPSVDDPYMTVGDNGIFELATWPSVRVSENDGLEGTGSCAILSPIGRIVRPGHTIYLTSVPDRFVAGYLVQDVNFSEFTNDPVDLSLVMVQKPKNQSKPDKD